MSCRTQILNKMAHFKFPYYDEVSEVYRDFTCPNCGCKEVVHISDTAISFYEASFMCCCCGMSVIDGKELNYYHDLFICRPIEQQLSLF